MANAVMERPAGTAALRPPGTARRLGATKAALYKTARFTEYAHRTLDLPPRRDPLRVAFDRVAYNGFTGRDECIFRVYLTAADDSWFGDYFESALEDFVL